jgi:predicted nucleic acid-binding protein
LTRETFADAGYWIALLGPDDDLHAIAIRLSEELDASPLVTTDGVLAEVLTFFCAAGENSRRAAAGLARDCLSDPDVNVVPLD